MTNPRNPGRRGARARKRPYEAIIREGSPPKSVHFGKNLIQGPSAASTSPPKPALQQTQEGYAADVDGQLHGELGASLGRKKRKAEDLARGLRQLGLAGMREPRMLEEDTVRIIEEAMEAYKDPDGAICSRMNDLKDKISVFATSFPAVPANQKKNVLDQLLTEENMHLVRFIGLLAQGGKNHVEGWHALLGDTTCRHALVLGIVGRALKEHVFSELYFGAKPEFLEALSKNEQDQVNRDGFYRHEHRVREIERYEWDNNRTTSAAAAEAKSFHDAIVRVMAQLEHMLLPFWKQSGTQMSWTLGNKQSELFEIVSIAANLSRVMRRSYNVVYYWPPTFKDEEFDPGRMEAFNLKSMIDDSPYEKEVINGMDRAVLREGYEDQSQAIVRVVGWPGLVAYRQGGGDVAEKELAEEAARQTRHEFLPPDVAAHRKRLASVNTNEPTKESGFRTRVVCKSVVLLQWGQQRLLTKEAGTSAHIDAMQKRNGKTMQKYDDDYAGFKELWNIYADHVWNGKTLEMQEQEFEEERRKRRGESPGLMTSMYNLWRSGSTASAEGDGGASGRKGSGGSRRASRGN